MSGYVVRQKKLSVCSNASFKEKIHHSKISDMKMFMTWNWHHKHSSRENSEALFSSFRFGERLRFVRWRSGVSDIVSPVHPMPTPIDWSVLGTLSGFVCKCEGLDCQIVDETADLLCCCGLVLYRTTTWVSVCIQVWQRLQWTVSSCKLLQLPVCRPIAPHHCQCRKL